jgi:hypothetical protein
LQLGLLVSAGAASLDFLELLGVLGLELRKGSLQTFNKCLDLCIARRFGVHAHDAARHGFCFAMMMALSETKKPP